MPFRPVKQAEPIPGYKLVRRLGQGGFGEVWKAEAPGGLAKAIKFVAGDLGNKEHGAAKELAALHRVKAIRHPFLLSLERVDIVDGQLVIVMELADRDLGDRLCECRRQGAPGIPRDELLRYAAEAAEALDLMNIRHGLQHMDIKPHNLFLVENHVKVADFGLIEDLNATKATAFGGTPAYAAPEVFEGKVSRFSDQYSLAVVYLELLTGRRPFPDVDSWRPATLSRGKPPDLSQLPPEDRPAVARALASEPNERFLTCMDFVRALGNSLRPPVASCAGAATVDVACPRCGHTGSVPGQFQGQSVRCPKCRSAFDVALRSSGKDTAVAMSTATPVDICLPKTIGLAPLDEEAAEVIAEVTVVIDVRCPGCGSRGTIAEELVGRQIRCPKCARMFPLAKPRPAAESRISTNPRLGSA